MRPVNLECWQAAQRSAMLEYRRGVRVEIRGVLEDPHHIDPAPLTVAVEVSVPWFPGNTHIPRCEFTGSPAAGYAFLRLRAASTRTPPTPTSVREDGSGTGLGARLPYATAIPMCWRLSASANPVAPL